MKRKRESDTPLLSNNDLYSLGHGLFRGSFLSSEACRHVIKLAEAHSSKHGGWSSNAVVDYAQKTVDLEVDRCPELKMWLNKVGLVEAIAARFDKVGLGTIAALDDLFVVKYSCKAQKRAAAETLALTRSPIGRHKKSCSCTPMPVMPHLW